MSVLLKHPFVIAQIDAIKDAVANLVIMGCEVTCEVDLSGHHVQVRDLFAHDADADLSAEAIASAQSNLATPAEGETTPGTPVDDTQSGDAEHDTEAFEIADPDEVLTLNQLQRIRLNQVFAAGKTI